MNKDLSIEHLLARTLGFLVLLIYLSNKFIPVSGESLEWFIYELVGLCGPVIVLGSYFGHDFHKTTKRRLTSKLLSYSSIFFLGLLLSLFITKLDFYPVLYSFLTFALLMCNSYFRNYFFLNKTFLSKRAHKLIIILILLTSCCSSLYSQPWWLGGFSKLLQANQNTVFISIASAILTTAALFSHQEVKPITPRKFKYHYLIDGLAIFLFLLFSFRIETNAHHLSFYTGTIELVRQGGWLLWDVPSQYGFLNILLVAFFPLKSVALSFYLVQGAINFSLNLLVYYFFRKVSSNFLYCVFAFLITFSAINLLPGMAAEMTGMTAFPSVGGFRFIFGYLLILIIFKLSQALDEQKFIKLSIIGNVLWAISCLWCTESIIYSSFAWFPGLIILLATRYKLYSFASIKRKHFFTLISPFLYLFLIVIFIDIYYLLFKGNMPDWFAFYEFAFTYKNGFGALAANGLGSFWIVTLLFAILVTLIIHKLLKKNYSQLPLLASSYCFLWATFSYFVSRSHENNILNLFPIFALSLAIILLVIKSGENRDAKTLNIGILPLFIPITTFIITVGVSTYSNKEYLASTLPLINGYQKLYENPYDKIKDAFPYIAELNIKNIAFLGNTLTPGSYQKFFDTNLWLPFVPYTGFGVLSSERQQIYLARHTERYKNGGWILFDPDNVPPTAFEWLYKNYTAGRLYYEKGLILQELIGKK